MILYEYTIHGTQLSRNVTEEKCRIERPDEVADSLVQIVQRPPEEALELTIGIRSHRHGRCVNESAPFAPGSDEPTRLQDTQVVGDRLPRDVQLLLQLRRAHLSATKHLEHAQTRIGR